MKKLINIFLVPVAAGLLAAGCQKKFNDLNINENKPTHVPPSLLLNGILYDMYDAPYTMSERYAQYYCCNYDYYGNNRYDFGSGDNYYSTLKNAQKMQEEAITNGLGEVNGYDALAKFFKAYFFTKMSLEMGDIPMSEALQGISNLKPAYDPQKQVFKQAFVWLDSANTELASLVASNGSISGDFYFDNNLAKWQKVVNTFRLRLLIHLSKKESDADLNIKQQFSDIVSNPAKYPIMESADDNLEFKYIHPTNDYPMNPDNFGFDALRYNTSGTYIGLLTQLKDPRVFVTAEPAGALVTGGKLPTSFDAFVGADPGEDLGSMYIKANSGQYSLINRKHYYDSYTGEPSIQIGYPELMFNIAEAINRGWIASGPLGNAEAYYKAGIKASMAFYGIPESGTMTAYFLHPGASLGTYDSYTVNVDFNTYYAQTAVAYAGNTAQGLNQILTQRYLALFRHSGLESYFTYRRTGVPTFTTGPGTGNSERIPMRFQYPGSERTANTDNYNKALQSQFNGNDDINGIMWILQ
ncbi:MAG TPA: SusD/RagB family nutrient-binding outer membrane lipoprotein [Chitinophagaceae bacterium]|nr:SusD/RagB family nutrient-binding outer membrane lipoprotein [Chitinophagaceae bacterium]